MGSLYSGAVAAQLHPIWKHEQFNRVCICQWGTHPKHGIVLGPGKAETKDERCSSWAAVMISRWVYVAWEICKEHWRRTGERRHFPQVLYISSLYKLQTSLHSTHWLIIFLVSTFILSQSVVAIMQVHRIGMCKQLFIVQNLKRCIRNACNVYDMNENVWLGTITLCTYYYTLHIYSYVYTFLPVFFFLYFSLPWSVIGMFFRGAQLKKSIIVQWKHRVFSLTMTFFPAMISLCCPRTC